MPSSDKYTLYELVGKAEDAQSQLNISPFVFTTICDLRILDIPFDEEKLTIVGIGADLSKETGNKHVTVPTLKVKEGEYVTDSLAIAEWLDAHHGTPECSLFDNSAGAHFARFLNVWVGTVLVPACNILWGPAFCMVLDAKSQQYYLRGKVPGGMDTINHQLDTLSDPAEVDRICAETRMVLKLLETYLEQSGGPFILGTKPSHCDAVIYGWYATSQLNAETVNPLIWEHPDLPRIKNWARAVNELVGIKLDFKVPTLKK